MADKRIQPIWDPIALAAQLRDIARQSQVLMRHFVSHQDAVRFGMVGRSTLGFDFFELMTRMMTDPMAVASAQIDLFYNTLGIWQKTAERMLMLRAREADASKDRRFKHPEWSANVIFNFVKDSYLVAAESILSAIRDVKGMDEASARKINFYTRQFVDALSPSNFVATNPEVTHRNASVRRTEPAAWFGEPSCRSGARQWPSCDYDDRHEGFLRGRKHRNDPGKNRLPKRAHATNPIYAVDKRSSQATTPHRAPMDQQILCPRSPAEELLHQMGCRSGTHSLCHFLDNPR